MLTLYRIKFTSKSKSYGGVAYLACEKSNILPPTELILEAVGKENMEELALKGVTDEGPVYVEPTLENVTTTEPVGYTKKFNIK